MRLRLLIHAYWRLVNECWRLVNESLLVLNEVCKIHLRGSEPH